MKIVLDMVMNHASVNSSWFKESPISRDNLSGIGISGDEKTKEETAQQLAHNAYGISMEIRWLTNMFLHQFLPFQPDLNYRNPEVVDEMLDTVRFWLRRAWMVSGWTY